MRRLIVNADDFGVTPAVTAGILEAHAAGTVTSTSMLVGAAGWEDGIRQARAATTLGVGLHFNLVAGAPLERVPSLTDAATGRYHPLPALVLRALLRRIDRDEIVAECTAQLAALRRAGVRVTHIDSHRHTHALPGVRVAVAAVAAQQGLPLRRPVETPWTGGSAASQLHRGVVTASWYVAGIGAPRVRCPDHFLGVSMQGSARFAERLARAVDAIAGGTTELMVHPGRVDAALQAADAYTWPRERELAALLSPALGERFRRGDLELIGFGTL